jgi:hypothetical protein
MENRSKTNVATGEALEQDRQKKTYYRTWRVYLGQGLVGIGPQIHHLYNIGDSEKDINKRAHRERKSSVLEQLLFVFQPSFGIA